ncbi:hypothetical protein [Rhodococcus opacus]|uniref:hypothetical protein n=1 Tax=Rhodococcus opacus TaxID=37919 RepID=UPI00403718A1
MIEAGAPKTEIAAVLGIRRATLYRHLSTSDPRVLVSRYSAAITSTDCGYLAYACEAALSSLSRIIRCPSARSSGEPSPCRSRYSATYSFTIDNPGLASP